MFFIVFMLICILAWEPLRSDPLKIQEMLFVHGYLYVNLCFVILYPEYSKFNNLNENTRKLLTYIYYFFFLTGGVFIGYINDLFISVVFGGICVIFTGFYILYYFNKEKQGSNK